MKALFKAVMNAVVVVQLIFLLDFSPQTLRTALCSRADDKQNLSLCGIRRLSACRSVCRCSCLSSLNPFPLPARVLSRPVRAEFTPAAVEAGGSFFFLFHLTNPFHNAIITLLKSFLFHRPLLCQQCGRIFLYSYQYHRRQHFSNQTTNNRKIKQF